MLWKGHSDNTVERERGVYGRKTQAIYDTNGTEEVAVGMEKVVGGRPVWEVDQMYVGEERGQLPA